jgi:hypothetical protein
MYKNYSPIEEYVNTIKGNINFLSRLFSPKVSIPIIFVFIMVIGLIAFIK